MICILTTPIDLANYGDVWNLHQRYPSEKISHISWADFSQMNAPETLYLLGHGSPDSLEDMSPDELAKLLVSKGLKNPIRKIKLLACASGQTRGNIPYCQALADKLLANKGPATVVIGFDGDVAVTNAGGITFAMDESRAIQWTDEVFDAKFGSSVKKWDKTAESLPYGSESEILESAELLMKNKQISTIFEWLYRRNKIYVKESTVGKTYGIPGQQF